MSTTSNKTESSKRVDLWELVRLANQGDESAIAKLREELQGKNAEALLSNCGDLAFQAEESILRVYLGEQKGSVESLHNCENGYFSTSNACAFICNLGNRIAIA